MRIPSSVAGLAAAFLCASCSTTPELSHGPISDRLLNELNDDAISRNAVMERVVSGQMRVSLAPPPQRTITLPFALRSSTPLVRVGVNGRIVPMVLDTGAVKTMIQAAVAADHEVTMLREEDASVSMRGVIGMENGRIGLLEPLQIGSWSLYAYPCIVRTHQNTLRGFFGDKHWSSDLLGFDVAAKLATYLTIDYPARTATWGFHQPFPTPSGPRVLKSKFKIVNGVPFVTLKAKGHSWEALVDSGSFNGIEISQDLAKKLKLGEGTAVTGLYLVSVGGSTTSAAAGLRRVKVPEISALGRRYPNAQVDISPGPPRIGSFFLKDYRVTFDFRRGLIWLE